MRATKQDLAVANDDLGDLDQLDREELERLYAAGREALEVQRVLAKTGDNVVGELLRHTGTFYEWDHYPKGDVYDSETHSQYYYHAHAADQRFPGEHGHFHTFLRPFGMPSGVKPAPLAQKADASPGPNEALSHLIGISMDSHGTAFRLFTVNRWVTGETWYKAQDVVRMLDCFEIDHARPSWATNRWITAVVRMFRPQIAKLVDKRDRTVAAWQKRYQPANVYEDRRLEVTSYMEIAVAKQVTVLEEALRRKQP